MYQLPTKPLSIFEVLGHTIKLGFAAYKKTWWTLVLFSVLMFLLQWFVPIQHAHPAVTMSTAQLKTMWTRVAIMVVLMIIFIPLFYSALIDQVNDAAHHKTTAVCSHAFNRWLPASNKAPSSMASFKVNIHCIKYVELE